MGRVRTTPGLRPRPPATRRYHPGVSVPEDTLDALGDLRRFRVLRKIGSGGMGEVYEARDLDRDEVVALKTLRRLDPGALVRLKNEFRRVAGLSHPNLVELRELVNDGPSWFFTMEYVDGTDFVSWVRRIDDDRDAGDGDAR